MKNFFIAFLGSFFAFFLLVLIGIMALVGAASMAESSQKVDLSDEHVLVIDLDGEWQDKPVDPLMGMISDLLNKPVPQSLGNTMLALKAAATDDRIQAIHLKVGSPMMGWASASELREALDSLSQSKTIIATGKVYSQKAYYIASVAEDIYLSPAGFIQWQGLGSQVTYYKGMLDKLGIKAHLIRGSDNTFKSAGEPFIRQHMSEAQTLQIKQLQNDLWSSINLPLGNETLETAANEQPLLTAEDAVTYGFIQADHSLYPTQWISHADSLHDIGLNEHTVSTEDYLTALDRPVSRDRVTVLYAEGNIVDGSGSTDVISDGGMKKAIDRLIKSKRTKAVVIRVNSGGGSALASDHIWHDVQRLAEKLPVVVSMGDVAASGGYYLAMPADVVMAQPMTITGSIGIFGLFFTAEDLLNNTLGLNQEVVGSHPFATFPEIDRAPTDLEQQLLQRQVDHGYNRFKNVVAEGRNLPRSTVDSLARGRVYSGSLAKQLDLIDQHGGLLAAIETAANLAELTDYRITTYKASTSPLSQFSSIFSMTSQWMDQGLSQLAESLEELEAMQGIQARWNPIKL
jgi:protease-4